MRSLIPLLHVFLGAVSGIPAKQIFPRDVCIFIPQLCPQYLAGTQLCCEVAGQKFVQCNGGSSFEIMTCPKGVTCDDRKLSGVC